MTFIFPIDESAFFIPQYIRSERQKVVLICKRLHGKAIHVYHTHSPLDVIVCLRSSYFLIVSISSFTKVVKNEFEVFPDLYVVLEVLARLSTYILATKRYISLHVTELLFA